MKRILVLSDTHGRTEKSCRIIDAIHPDAVIHLGDLVRDAEELSYIYDEIPFYKVRGNNDFAMLDAEHVYEIFGFRFYCAHGHSISVSRGIERAKEEKCHAFLYGHTHKSDYFTEDNIIVMNPGSITRPRNDTFSFGVFEIENDTLSGCVCPADGY